MSAPWLKFFPTDWRSDPRLRMCSMAARGLWIEMIALMHEATPYGHLLVSGRSPTDAQIAVLAGAPSEQVSDALGELEAAGVFSRTREGVIYSRKMTRMQKKAATARNNGRKGGNPNLGKPKGNPASDNPVDKGGLKPQKPEARSQTKKEREAVASPKQSRGCSLPDGWVPSEKNRADAYAKDFTDQEIDHEADKFRDYHQSKGTRFKNWDAGWRTWLANAREFRGRRVAGASNAGGHGQGGSIASIVARRHAAG